MNNKKIIVALDSINLYDSKYLVDEIKNQVFAFKIGYDFFFSFGLDGYNQIKNKKVNIFLDLKLHDIPNTIKNGIEAISNLKMNFVSFVFINSFIGFWISNKLSFINFFS